MRYAFVPIHLAKLNYSLSTMTPYFYSPPCYYTGPSHIIPQLHYCNILLMDLFHVCLHCLLSYFVLNSAARVRLLTHKTDHVIHAQNFLMSLLSQRWSQSLFSCLQVPTQSNRPTPTVSSFLLVLSPTQFEPCFLLAAPLNRPSTFLVESLHPAVCFLRLEHSQDLNSCPSRKAHIWLFQISVPLAFLIYHIVFFSQYLWQNST